jgi:hypothetical protein
MDRIKDARRRAATQVGAAWWVCLGLAAILSPVRAADEPPPAAAANQPAAVPDLPGIEHPERLKRLDPESDAWLDPVGKRVVLRGEVCLQDGPLEMFACPTKTKEHESVVAVNTKAYVVHAALLALGAEAGSPAKFIPEYSPAHGTEIDITVFWKEPSGKVAQARAQDWVRNARTGKPLEHPWVFGGSMFSTDPMTGERFYQAEYGDLICVSNFPTAMLDLPIESPQANAALFFESNSDRVPPRGTPVVLVLTPRFKP